MSISVRMRTAAGDWEAMRAFLARHYRPDLALCSRRQFAWQFGAGLDDGSARVMSAWDGDRLVGILGYIPVPVSWGTPGEPVEGAWLVSWMADADYRHGVGVALLRQAQTSFPVLLGIDASHENERIVKRLGWKFHARLPRFLGVLDPARASRVLMPGASPDDLRRFTLGDGRAGDVTPRPLGTGEDYRPDWRLYPSMAFGTVRSRSFLKWRYQDHPAFNYAIAILGDPGRPAVCVYRAERALGIEGEVGVARLVEFFHPDDDAGRRDGLRLIRAVAGRLRAAGCAFADFIGTSATSGETLREAGWAPESGDLVLPIRVRPVETKPFHYNFEYGVARGLPCPAVDQVYVTKSDGDSDRPSSISEVREPGEAEAGARALGRA